MYTKKRKMKNKEHRVKQSFFFIFLLIFLYAGNSHADPKTSYFQFLCLPELNSIVLQELTHVSFDSSVDQKAIKKLLKNKSFFTAEKLITYTKQEDDNSCCRHPNDEILEFNCQINEKDSYNVKIKGYAQNPYVTRGCGLAPDSIKLNISKNEKEIIKDLIFYDCRNTTPQISKIDVKSSPYNSNSVGFFLNSFGEKWHYSNDIITMKTLYSLVEKEKNLRDFESSR